MEQPPAPAITRPPRLRPLSTLRAFRFSGLLAALYLLALAIHLAAVIPFLNAPIALDDMFQYDMLARSIQHGDGYRWYTRADFQTLKPYYSTFLPLESSDFPVEGIVTTWRAPGYPAFLALIYALVPAAARVAAARLAQAALLAALAPLTAALAARMGASRRAALLAGGFIGLYPLLLFYPLALASENLYVPLGAACLLALIAAQKGSPRVVVLAGLLAGAAMLTRSIFAIFTLLAGVWLLRQSPRRRAALLFWLIAFGMCLPWSIRNSLIAGRPTFVETSAGYNMFISYHPEGDGGFVSDIAIRPLVILDDTERDRTCTQQALAFIRANPGEAARRVLARVGFFLGVEDREFLYLYTNNILGFIAQPWLALLYLLLVLPWGTALALGVSGLWQAPNRRVALLPALFLLAYILPHLLIIAEPRFHLAWLPALAAFAAARNPRSKNRLPLVMVTVFVLLVFVVDIASGFPSLAAVMRAGGNLLRNPY